jgi:hypothetical protein
MSTTPFTPEELMKLYPTHDDYVTQVEASVSRQQDGGFLLAPEGAGFVSDAEQANVPE